MIALSRLTWQLIGSGGIVALLVTSCVMRDHAIENRGAERQAAKTEKANTNAANQGKSAAAKSVSGGVRGQQRDPTTRND